MEKKFEVVFLDDAIDFINQLDEKSRNKVFYNINKSKHINDPKLIEKLEAKYGISGLNSYHFNI